MRKKDDSQDFQNATRNDQKASSVEEIEMDVAKPANLVAESYNQGTSQQKFDLIYTVEDVLPFHMSFLLGMQHYMTSVGATISIPLLLAPILCIPSDDPANGQLISTIFFVSGIVTFIQTTFGIRLPIVQGGTYAFLLPTISIIENSFEKCDSIDFSNMTFSEKQDVWTDRIRLIQGSIITASLFQVLIGITGIVGLLRSFITPLTIVPTISLVGMSLFKHAADSASGNWGIALMTFFLLLLFSQYLSEVEVPLFSFARKEFTKVKIFKLFPVILAIIISWAVCAILTVAGALEDDSPIRTDNRISVLSGSPWFYIPYPFQWGTPLVSTSGVLGMMAGVIASIVESIGDYYACARLSNSSMPPMHAINRGIAIEGIGCIIAGIFGSGNGTTSYSENIGAIRITKVASRRAVQAGAIVFIAFALFGKFGALFITLPDPVIGGMFLVIFGIITAVGLSNLKMVDLDSSRNIFILGVSLFCGLAIPEWMVRNPRDIDTSSENFNQVTTVLLRTHMFVGGFLGLVLDNSIPGSDEERGLTHWKMESENNISDSSSDESTSIYDLPFGMELIRRYSSLSRIPISPTYTIKNEKTFLEKLQTIIPARLKACFPTKEEDSI